jgi:hypothetical protein
MIEYPGNIPMNVSRDAKYSVVTGKTGMEVRLIYRVSDRERRLLTTDKHDELVEMVNAVKTSLTGSPGGAFYINEYRDVLVPGDGACFYAGNYAPNLEFDFDGSILGPRAPVELSPGNPWPGPHVGIRHVITAGAQDIRYTRRTRHREVDVYLSDHIGMDDARRLAGRLSMAKTSSGGRIYVNEALAFFARIEKGGRWEYVYLGWLEEDGWFDPPDVPRPGD